LLEKKAAGSVKQQARSNLTHSGALRKEGILAQHDRPKTRRLLRHWRNLLTETLRPTLLVSESNPPAWSRLIVFAR
jgi:hypothetical protein